VVLEFADAEDVKPDFMKGSAERFDRRAPPDRRRPSREL